MWTFVSNKFKKMIKPILLILICVNLICLQHFFACAQVEQKIDTSINYQNEVQEELVLGNEQIEQYLPLLEHKAIGFVGNHSSLIGGKHLVDSLLNLGVNIKRVFSPEHGFRGQADAGEKIKSSIDSKTKLPISSLYGKNKRPTKAQLNGIDILLFDIQDVGARFYTYISTLHYVMEAAAIEDIPLIVLDRPNPNGHYVDGPILEKEFKSFVGMHPVPIIHGMSIGEYAQMINGEGWLENGINCELKVIACRNYKRDQPYVPEVRPSPNLPNERAILLYPFLCLFEGTAISVGRGTSLPFQQIGAPSLSGFEHSFRPVSGFGAKKPKYEGKDCNGIDFSMMSIKSIREKRDLDLSYLIQFYESYPDKTSFFTNFFDLLAGNSNLRKAIENGKTMQEIRTSWASDLSDFKDMRQQYLLYPDL